MCRRLQLPVIFKELNLGVVVVDLELVGPCRNARSSSSPVMFLLYLIGSDGGWRMSVSFVEEASVVH